MDNLSDFYYPQNFIECKKKVLLNVKFYSSTKYAAIRFLLLKKKRSSEMQ